MSLIWSNGEAQGSVLVLLGCGSRRSDGPGLGGCDPVRQCAAVPMQAQASGAVKTSSVPQVAPAPTRGDAAHRLPMATAATGPDPASNARSAPVAAKSARPRAS